MELHEPEEREKTAGIFQVNDDGGALEELGALRGFVTLHRAAHAGAVGFDLICSDENENIHVLLDLVVTNLERRLQKLDAEIPERIREVE